jgi:peptide/nickel transport system substrate-binding protein
MSFDAEVGGSDGSSLSRRDLLKTAAAIGVALGAAGPATALAAKKKPAPPPPKPKRGGRLRVAQIGAGASEGLQPGVNSNTVSACRMFQMYDSLFRPDQQGNMQLAVAQSVEPNADGSLWTIKLKKGVTWWDGKTLTSDDVIDSLQFSARPGSSAAGIAKVYFDVANLKKIDDATFQLPCLKPVGDIMGLMRHPHGWAITRADHRSDWTNPMGTGPFTLESFNPGVSSLMKRNPNYWDKGKPYVDEIEIDSVSDDSARLNALLSGQVDVAEAIPRSQVPGLIQGKLNVGIVKGKSVNLAISLGKIASYITMAVDTAPFTDPRVRQAMRLIADRPGLVNQALAGIGRVGNDLLDWGMQYYASDLPQRKQDIEQAKSLLAQAGQSNLTLTMRTSAQAEPAFIESALAYAQQAKLAGVTINLNNVPSDQFFNSDYTQNYFSQDYVGAIPLIELYNKWYTSSGAFNVTHYRDPTYDALVAQATGAVDPKKAKQHWHDAQLIQYNQGGSLVWGFLNAIDGVAKNVQGYLAGDSYPVGNYLVGRESWFLT